MHFVSEVPYGLWLTLACGFTLQALNSKKNITSLDIVAGILWGITILTRPQMMFAVPIAGSSLFFSSHANRRRHFTHLIVQACLLLGVLAPWVIRNAIIMGKPTLSTVGGYTFWGAHNEIVFHDPQFRGSWVRTSDLINEQHPIKGNEIEKESTMWRYGLESIERNLTQMPILIAMKIWRVVSPISDTPNRAVLAAFAAGWLITMPLVLWGSVLGVRDGCIAAAVLLIPILATLTSVVIFYGSDRFRDSASSIFVILAARAMVELTCTRFPRICSTVKELW
jgi:hypothetical protein